MRFVDAVGCRSLAMHLSSEMATRWRSRFREPANKNLEPAMTQRTRVCGAERPSGLLWIAWVCQRQCRFDALRQCSAPHQAHACFF
jgi:hypothetical protein